MSPAPDPSAPERIFLQRWMTPEPTWCAERVAPSDVEYVRVDIVARLTEEIAALNRQLAEVISHEEVNQAMLRELEVGEQS